MPEDNFQVGFGDQEQVGGQGKGDSIGRAQQAQGAHLDLALGFFAGDVQHRPQGGHADCHLQGESGFADAGVAANQDDGAGHDAAPQDAGKFGDGERQAFFGIPADFVQAARRGGEGCAAGGGFAPRFGDDDLLYHAVPRPAGGAASHRAHADAPAFLAHVTGFGFGHRVLLAKGGTG